VRAIQPRQDRAGKYLDGDIASQSMVVSAVDHAHATFTND
jgi:hypothetical protein